jgi:hypothetical protein
MIALLFISTLVESSTVSPVVVFNLTETLEGLFIPFQSDSGIVNVRVVSQYYLGSMLMAQISQYPSINASISENTREPYIPPLSIAHNSPFGNFYRNAIISSREEVGFQLIAGITDPSAYCRDEIISTAHFSYPTLFHIKVSLVQNENRPDSPNIVESPVDFATINTLRKKDRIPSEVYEALMEELRLLIDISPFEPRGFDDLIPSMRSIQYTIYRNDEGTDAVANIVLMPEDYLRQNLDGLYELQVEPAEFAPMLGVNFLRHVSIYLNYADNEIGFCDPH